MQKVYISKTTTLHVHHALLYISLLSLHTVLSRTGTHNNKFLFFPELWYSPLELNSKKNCQHFTKATVRSYVKRLLPLPVSRLMAMQDGPYPSSPEPLYQKDYCSAFDMEMIFHPHANKTQFHKKGCAFGLILKVRVFGTRKWPVVFENLNWKLHCGLEQG